MGNKDLENISALCVGWAFACTACSRKFTEETNYLREQYYIDCWDRKYSSLLSEHTLESQRNEWMTHKYIDYPNQCVALILETHIILPSLEISEG